MKNLKEIIYVSFIILASTIFINMMMLPMIYQRIDNEIEKQIQISIEDINITEITKQSERLTQRLRNKH